jgi:two-component system sensor histidine kinase RegB
MSSASVTVRHDVAWLQAVRWATSAILWAVLAVTWAFPSLDLSLRGIAVLGLAAAICRTGVLLTGRSRSTVSVATHGIALVSDALLLTGLLDITGGPFNPFIVMYVTYVWVALVVVSRTWAGVVAMVSLAGFGWLVIDHLQAGLLEHHRLNDLPTHLFTMWFAGAGVAELVAHYVAQARGMLSQRQAELDAARDRAARSERLAALTTLAAGAAHELSTPLATIAVAAGELERNAERVAATTAVGPALVDDARLIRAEMDRCRAILDSMSGRAGAGLPTTLEPMTPAAIVRLLEERLGGARRERLAVHIAPDTPIPSATGAEMVQAISSLLKNAFEASSDGVVLRFAAREGMVRVEVSDGGAGMSPEVRRRAGEPFFTTNVSEGGLGLGLFLVRTFAERSGGTLEFDAAGGTIAILEIPAVARGSSVPA